MITSYKILVVLLVICTATYSQDTTKSEKKKWLPSVKMPFKEKKSEDDTINKSSKFAFWKKDKTDSSESVLSFSKMFGYLRKDIDTLKFHESFSIGIGSILDSATSLTESFEILQFFQENPMVFEGKKVPVKLVSHPSQANIVVTGSIQHHYTNKCRDKGLREKCDAYETMCNFHVWKNGYKVSFVKDYQIVYPGTFELNAIKEETSVDQPLYDGTFRVIRFGLDRLYRTIYHYTGQDEKTLPAEDKIEKIMDCSTLNEFAYSWSKRGKLDKRDLSELLPGYVVNYVPRFDTAATLFIRNEKFAFLTAKDFESLNLSADEPAKLTNAIYRYVDNNEFRSMNSKYVPEKIKLELEPIIAPKSSWVGAAIAYLLAGDKFLEKGDWAAAELAYESCIFLSGKTNSSMQVKYELRLLAVQGLLKIAKMRERKVGQQFLLLVTSLINDYLQSPEAREFEVAYRTDIDQFQKVCFQIDDQIAQLKKQNIAGKVMSAVEFASAVVFNDTRLAEKSGARLVESSDAKSKGKRALVSELSNVEIKDKLLATIESNSVQEMTYGSVYLSKMIWEILSSDNLNKKTISHLRQFAIDKPTVMQSLSLLESSTEETYQERAKLVIKKLVEIESNTIRTEKRG